MGDASLRGFAVVSRLICFLCAACGVLDACVLCASDLGVILVLFGAFVVFFFLHEKTSLLE